MLPNVAKMGVTVSRGGRGTLTTTLNRVRGRFNGNSVVHLNRSHSVSIRAVSANSLSLSVTLKTNNLPVNHVIRVCKPRSSNGAALALRIVTTTRHRNGAYTFVSTRRTLSPVCTHGLNISVSGLLYSRPSANRRTLRVYSTLTHSNTMSIVIISSITTLAPGTRVRNRVNSSRVNLTTHVVDRTVHGLTNGLGRSGALLVFVGRVHVGVNIVFNGPRAAANNGTLGFCTSIHLSVHHVNTIGRNRGIINDRAHIGIIGGGVTTPFGRTRFRVLCNRNVGFCNRLISLNMGRGLVRGTNT